MKFGELLDSMSDEELGAKVRDRYARLADAHAKGIADEHPYAQWNRDNATLRAHRSANDNRLEGTTTAGVTGGPRNGEKVTQDAALKQHEANVRETEQTRETEEFIPGYGRL